MANVSNSSAYHVIRFLSPPSGCQSDVVIKISKRSSTKTRTMLLIKNKYWYGLICLISLFYIFIYVISPYISSISFNPRGQESVVCLSVNLDYKVFFWTESLCRNPDFPWASLREWGSLLRLNAISCPPSPHIDRAWGKGLKQDTAGWIVLF